ncbi:MAG: hypothetical protein ACR2MA_02590 [Egibacteraceae bacterium]
MRGRQPRRWTVLLAGILLIAVAACDQSGEGADASASSGSEPAPSVSASPTAGTATTAEGSGASGAGTTVQSSIEGLQMEVLSLERAADNIVTLQFELNYDGEDSVQTGQQFAERVEDGPFASGPYLVDGQGRNKYLVLRDADGRCLCSELDLWLDPGSTVSAFTQFPAPPADVRRMTVYVPTFPPISGVPLRGRS